MEEIEEIIKTEEGCHRLISLAKYSNGTFQCANCGNDKAYAIRSRSLMQCSLCGKQTSVTAGTLFHGMRIPIVKAFRIIFEVANGRGRSSTGLARELDLAPSTVWRFLHRLRKILHDSFHVSNSERVQFELLNKVLFKHSSESFATVDASPKCSDESVVDRDHYKADKNHTQTNQMESKAARALIQFIMSIFQGVSRKYCQFYAAQFTFVVGFCGQFEMLLSACIRAGPICEKEITLYKSPDLISVPSTFC